MDLAHAWGDGPTPSTEEARLAVCPEPQPPGTPVDEAGHLAISFHHPEVFRLLSCSPAVTREPLRVTSDGSSTTLGISPQQEVLGPLGRSPAVLWRWPWRCKLRPHEAGAPCCAVPVARNATCIGVIGVLATHIIEVALLVDSQEAVLIFRAKVVQDQLVRELYLL